MSLSGVCITDGAKAAFNRVFNGKKDKKLPYAVLKYDCNCENVIVDKDPKFYKKCLEYNGVIDMLPDNEPRIVIYDFAYLNKDGTKTSTVILASWFPKNTNIKLRFVAGSSFMSIVQSFNVQKYIEGGEASDVDEEAVCYKMDWTMLPAAMREILPETVNIDDC